ncbi:MAG: hypothetical protein D6679_08085, partial [Candidatus Hydrogenedentota bacterium]
MESSANSRPLSWKRFLFVLGGLFFSAVSVLAAPVVPVTWTTGTDFTDSITAFGPVVRPVFGDGAAELGITIVNDTIGPNNMWIRSFFSYKADTLFAGGFDNGGPNDLAPFFERTSSGWTFRGYVGPSGSGNKDELWWGTMYSDTLWIGVGRPLAGGADIAVTYRYNPALDTFVFDVRWTDSTTLNWRRFREDVAQLGGILYISGRTTGPGGNNNGAAYGLTDGINYDARTLKQILGRTANWGNDLAAIVEYGGLLYFTPDIAGGSERDIGRSNGVFAGSVIATLSEGILSLARLNDGTVGDTLFAGGVNGTLFRSTDGTTWTTIGDINGAGAFSIDDIDKFGPDLWLSSEADNNLYRYVARYDTAVLMGSVGGVNFRPYTKYASAVTGDTWLYIGGEDNGVPRAEIYRVQFLDSGTWTSDTIDLQDTTGYTHNVGDSVEFSVLENAGTVTVVVFTWPEGADTTTRSTARAETFTFSGQTFLNPDTRPSNSFRYLQVDVHFEAPLKDATPILESLTIHVHGDTAPPPTVTNRFPLDKTETNIVDQTFRWNAENDSVPGVVESGLDTYVLQISRDSSMAVIDSSYILFGDTQGVVSFGPVPLLGDTVHFWRVLVVDTAGNVATGETYTLTVDVTPPNPGADTALQPLDFEDTTERTLTLRWLTAIDTLSGIARYVVERDSGATLGFISPVTDTVYPPDTFLAIDLLGLSKTDTWFWRVTVYDSATNATVSPIFSFRVRTQAAVFLEDSRGVVVTDYTVRDTFTVVVADTDRNRDPAVADTLRVTVATAATGDTKSLLLTEIGVNANLFSGTLTLSDTTENGFLLAAVGDTIRVLYEDSMPPFQPIETGETYGRTTRISTNGMAGFDSTGYRIFETPVTTITDPDRNRDPRRRDTVSVLIWNKTRNDSEAIVYRETTDTSGVFSGDTLWISDTIGENSGDSILFAGPGDILILDYTDAYDGADTGRDTATVVRTFRSASGTAVDSRLVSVDSAAPFDTLGFRVTDPDGNADVALRDTIAVLARNLTTGETEIFVLVETTETSGIFGPDTGVATSLAPADSVSGTGTLFGIPGQTIRLEYEDAGDASDTAADTIVILFRPTNGTVRLTDSLGSPADTASRDSTLSATVSDSDQNRDGAIPETVGVAVRSVRAGDSETLTLTETDSNSGDFRNLVALAITDTGAGGVGDGILTVRPAYDTIFVEYRDDAGRVSDTIAYRFTRSRSRMQFIDRFGKAADQFTSGETISARVYDEDQNATVASEGSAETVAVFYYHLGTGDSEKVVLRETANLSAQFDSVVGIPTSANPLDSLPFTGVLFALPGDTIVVRYTDPADGTDTRELIIVASSTPTSSSADFTDSVGSSVATYALPDSRVYATVADTDENLFPGGLDDITATFWCPATNDTETLVLTETGNDSNIFRNTTGLPISDTLGSAVNDGVLLVGRADTIVFVYEDPNDPSDSATVTADLSASTTPATVAFDSSGYLAPTTMTIVITDADRNFDPRTAETLGIAIRGLIAGDSETITLTETTETSGVFSGSLPVSNLAGAGAGDGTLMGGLGETVQAEYADSVNPGIDTGVDTAIVFLAPTASRGDLLDKTLLAVDTALRAETITARVVDADASIDPLAIDTVGVIFENVRTGETEPLDLFETAVRAETFVSRVGIALSGSLSDSLTGDALLYVVPGDTVRLLYVQGSDTAGDTMLITVAPSTGAVVFRNGSGAVTDTAKVGADSLFLTFADTDRNRDGTRAETVLVVLTVSGTGDGETVVLTEEDRDSPDFRFTGGVPVVDTAAVVVQDGILVAGPGDTIEALFTDPDNGDTAFDTVLVTANLRVSSTRFLPIGVTTYTTSDSTRVEVIDPNANHDPTAIETVAVLVTNPRTGETEPLDLFETGPYSGVFRFETGLPHSTNVLDSVSATGVLYVVSSDTIEVLYADADDAADTAFDTVLIVPPPSNGSVIFSDSFGNSISTYPMDTFLYVTVQDTDRNVNGAAIETITAVVFDTMTGDTETVNLVEQGANSFLFRNAVAVSLSDTLGAVVDDGVLFTGTVLTIQVLYTDLLNGDTAADTANLTPAVTSASLLLDRSGYAPETRVIPTLTDPDRNRNPLLPDSVSVIVSSPWRADTETFVLTETTDTSGVFTAASGFRLSDTIGFAVGDDTLLVALGDTFLVSYSDAYDASDTAETVGAVLALNTSSTVAFDLPGYQVTDSVVVFVTDRDRNLDPRAFDTIVALVWNPRVSDTETLVLTETDSASLTFRNDTVTLKDTGAVTVGDGFLRVGNGDEIRLLYSDPVFSDTNLDSATILPIPTAGVVSVDTNIVWNGETFVITVVDGDRNLDQTAVETIVLRNAFVKTPQDVIVENEFQTIKLVETSDTSGVFVSQPITVRTDVTPTPGDRILLIGRNYSIEVEYQDATNGDFDTTGLSVTWFQAASSASLDRPFYVPGLRIFGTVSDSDENAVPIAKDTVTFIIRNAGTGETEVRIGYEGANLSGIFNDTAGLLTSASVSDSVSNDGILFIRTGDTVVIDYADSDNASDTSTDTATVGLSTDTVPSATWFSNANGVVQTAYRMDSLVFITVRDTDQNFSGLFKETVTVDVYDSMTGDSERIKLTELAADSGIFRNQTGLPLSDTVGAVINDGVLFTGPAFSITVFYQDALVPSDSSTDTAGINRLPSASFLFFDSPSYAPESAVTVFVGDSDRNRNPIAKDTVTITIWSPRRADTETVLLYETTETSALFANTAPIRISDTEGFNVGDGILLVALGDTFAAGYTDAYDATDSANSSAGVDTLGTLSTVALDAVFYTVADSVVITVTDRDRNLDPRSKDTVVVSVRNTRNGDSETLTLTETDSASLAFRTNQLNLTDTGAPVPGDGNLRVGPGDTFLVEYSDPRNGDTGSETAAITAAPTAGRVILPLGTVTDGDTLPIFVEDLDQNLDQTARDTILLRNVYALSPDSVIVDNEFQTLLLFETADTSGLFELPGGLKITTARAPNPGDSFLLVGFNFTVIVEYQDQTNGDFDSGSATVTWFQTPSSAAPDRAIYAAGMRVIGQVTDTDANRLPTAKDTVLVTVTNLATGESEVRLLEEDAVRSGTFSDTLGLLLTVDPADSVSNDGARMFVRTADSIEVRYLDAFDGTDSSSDTALIGTPGETTPSLTTFVDGNGNAVSVFAMDSLVFVQVRDTGQNLSGALIE